MKNALKQESSWTRRRFLWVICALFVLQAGLILLFGERSRPQPPWSAPSIRFRALGASLNEDQLLRQFFVGDPAVFALLNRHGFSGRGWLNQRPLEYQSENQLEPPDLLPLSTALLGTHFPTFKTDFQAVPAGLADQQSRIEEPTPDFLPPEIITTQSVFRLEGGLNDRLLGAGPALRVQPSEKLLTNSMVQIAVDPAGEVVAARLDASCGSPEADAEAVAKARALRFRPAPSAATQWGEAVFQWQTTEPAGADPPKEK
jgi:TonB family protein